MVDKTFTFCLPDIGEGVVEGEVVEWLKNVGDTVQQDEPVVVVMTDKVTVELPSPNQGKLVKQYYKPGEIAYKDKPLYDLLVEGNIPAKKVARLSRSEPGRDVLAAPTVAVKSSKVIAIPKVRHEAKEWEVDLNKISGSGPEGRVTESDLHHAVVKQEASFVQLELAGDETQQLVGVRGLMARKMQERLIPQFSYFELVDATRLIQLRNNIKEKAAKEGINLSYMPFFIRALSQAIKHFPHINASINMQEGKVVFHKQQNIGIAMATPQGLIVPVLKKVENMDLIKVIHAYEELKNKAITGKLSSEDMKEATVTISNFGVLGGEGVWATPMITESEMAILALAKIRKMPVVKDDQVVVREMLPLSWSFDHRLIDGELAAQISAHYCSLLKNPTLIL
jgi:pyruvate dehydrogenase E2 component (dihydrolipoamide acetyltransferase)